MSIRHLSHLSSFSSDQLSYEATDVGSWSVMCSYVPVKEMNVTDVYEINHISTAEMKSSEE